jgi:hypothetical protein
MKSTIQKAVIGLLTLGLVGFALQGSAQTEDKAPAKKPASENSKKEEAKKQRTLPFRGTLTAVDKAARTLTVGKRVFQITSETKVCKGPEKAPATLADAVIGERITGSYQQTADGKLMARSIYLGGQTAAAPGTKPKEGKKSS